MSQGTEIPPPNKRIKSNFDIHGGSVNSVNNGEGNTNFTSQTYVNSIYSPHQSKPSSSSRIITAPATATAAATSTSTFSNHSENMRPSSRMIPQGNIVRDTDKYSNNLYSVMGKQSFPKYVAQIASTLNTESKEVTSELSTDPSFIKQKRDVSNTIINNTTTSSMNNNMTSTSSGMQTSTTTAPQSTLSVTTSSSSSLNSLPQSKSLTTMGNTNNKFFGVSKTSSINNTSSSSSSSSISSSNSNNNNSSNSNNNNSDNGNNNNSNNNNNNNSNNNNNVIANIGLLGTWFPPPQAKWFRIDTIHDIEKQALPEFFSGKNPTKTPQIYKEYRDFMITSYRQNIKPPSSIPGSSGSYHPHHLSAPIIAAGATLSSSAASIVGAASGPAGASATSIAAATAAAAANPAAGGISFTMCRRYLTGDVSAIYQVYRFLEHWGLIANHKTSFVTDGSGSLPLDCPIPGADPTIIPSYSSSSLNVAAEIAKNNSDVLLSDELNNNNNNNIIDSHSSSSSSSSSITSVKIEDKNNDGVDDDDGDGGDNEYSDDDKEAQNVDYGSHHCVFIEHTANIPDNDDANGNRWIRYEDVMGNEKDIWTDQETFLLLEALKTCSSWSDVSQYVATKTPHQCFEHFLKLPINTSQLPSKADDSTSSSDDTNAVDTLAELIRSTPGCTDALLSTDAMDAGDGLDVAARVGLGIARYRAAELVKEEDAAIEELLTEAIDAQAQKVDIKLKYLSKYERLLQGEWKALSELKNSLISEKVVLVSSIIKNEEAAAAAAAAAAAGVGVGVGMDGGVGDMVDMGIDMDAVQQQDHQQNQQDQQQQQQHHQQQQQQENQARESQQDQSQTQESQQDQTSLIMGEIGQDEMQSSGSQFLGSPSLFSSGSF